MKKQFAIKPAQVLKKGFFSTAKKESATIFNFLGDGVCCQWQPGATFQGLTPKTTFSL